MPAGDPLPSATLQHPWRAGSADEPPKFSRSTRERPTQRPEQTAGRSRASGLSKQTQPLARYEPLADCCFAGATERRHLRWRDARLGRPAVVSAQARDTIAYAARSRRPAVLGRRARSSSNASVNSTLVRTPAQPTKHERARRADSASHGRGHGLTRSATRG